MIAGVAIGAVWFASTTLIGCLFRIERRGTALGVLTTSAPAGFAVGQVIGPRIGAVPDGRQSWQLVACVSAGSVAFFAVAHLSVGRSAVDIKPTPTTDEGSDSALPSVRQGFSAVLRNRNVVLGAGVAFVAYSLSLLLNSWLPTYLLEEFALSPSTSGLFAAVFPAMGVVSRAGGGLISDRLFGHQRLPVLKWPVVFVNSMYPDFREPVNTPPVEAVHNGERAGWRNARRSTDCASNPGAVTNRDTCTLSRTDNTGVSV